VVNFSFFPLLFSLTPFGASIIHFLSQFTTTVGKKNFSKQPPRRSECNISGGVAGHQHLNTKVASMFFSDGVYIQGLFSSSETKRYLIISNGAGGLGGSGVLSM
jgi:hypothetical protein